MEQELPYVTAALFCEKVLEQKDGVLSAIRIIDRATIEYGVAEGLFQSLVEGSQQKIDPGVQITGLVSLKAGSLNGTFNIHIEAQKPSGKRSRLHTLPIQLSGGDSGANFVLNLVIGATEEGTHWFDVLFEDRLLTRIPLTISLVRRQVAPQGAAPPERE